MSDLQINPHIENNYSLFISLTESGKKLTTFQILESKSIFYVGIIFYFLNTSSPIRFYKCFDDLFTSDVGNLSLYIKIIKELEELKLIENKIED